MNYELLHNPSYGAVEVSLAAGESVIGDSGPSPVGVLHCEVHVSDVIGFGVGPYRVAGRFQKCARLRSKRALFPCDPIGQPLVVNARSAHRLYRVQSEYHVVEKNLKNGLFSKILRVNSSLFGQCLAAGFEFVI